MVYKWKSGARIKGNAQEAGELFEQLSRTEEGLTARTLLEANKLEEAPLHDDYEWNDEAAADKWRLQQSNHFMNSIVAVRFEESDSEDLPEEVRAFHITTEQHKYDPLSIILQSPTKYEALLSTALSELRAFQRKYNTLKELQPVFKAISEVEV